jgi:hypothetical protein
MSDGEDEADVEVNHQQNSRDPVVEQQHVRMKKCKMEFKPCLHSSVVCIVVGEMVYWEFVDDGCHIMKNDSMR